MYPLRPADVTKVKSLRGVKSPLSQPQTQKLVETAKKAPEVPSGVSQLSTMKDGRTVLTLKPGSLRVITQRKQAVSFYKGKNLY